jgi:hypothetical protein
LAITNEPEFLSPQTLKKSKSVFYFSLYEKRMEDAE